MQNLQSATLRSNTFHTLHCGRQLPIVTLHIAYFFWQQNIVYWVGINFKLMAHRSKTLVGIFREVFLKHGIRCVKTPILQVRGHRGCVGNGRVDTERPRNFALLFFFQPSLFREFLSRYLRVTARIIFPSNECCIWHFYIPIKPLGSFASFSAARLQVTLLFLLTRSSWVMTFIRYSLNKVKHTRKRVTLLCFIVVVFVFSACGGIGTASELPAYFSVLA